MRVEVRPKGKANLTYDLTPTFSSVSPGGYKEARLTLPDAMLYTDRLLDSKVVISDGDGPCWMGDVWAVSGTDVTCSGPQARLSLDCHSLPYCLADLDAWKERTSTTRNRSIGIQADSTNVLRFVWQDGVNFADAASNGAVHTITPTTGVRVAFSWVRPSTAYAISAWTGVVNASGANGEPYTWTKVWEQVHSAGATSGTCDQAATGTDIVAVLILVYRNGALSPANYLAHIDLTNVRVFAVPGVAQTGTLTATTVITDLTSRMSTDDLPSSTTAWIGSETTALEPFGTIDYKRLDEVLADCLEYVDWDFRFEAREVSGKWWPVPIFEARSTTPDYIVNVDDESVVADLAGSSMDTLTSVVRVRYKDATGTPKFVDVTDTDATHRLVALGREKVTLLDIDTTDTTLATAVGTRYLVDAGASEVSGTVRIEGRVKTPSGASVLPTRIKPGGLLRLIGGAYGSLDARIVEVACTGESEATLTLDNTPDLARLVARAMRSRAKL